MNYINRLLYGIVLTVFFAQTPIPVFAFSSIEFVGKVIVKHQGVVVDRQGAALKVNAFGRKLKSGDIVVTGDTGKAHVMMDNGDVIILAPWTKLTILDKENPARSVKSSKRTFSFDGKIRAQIKRTKNRKPRFKSANAEINIKGTEFVAQYAKKITTVATLEGLVNMSSTRTGNDTDIPPGKMSSVSIAGEVMPLSEIAGEIMKGVDSAGEKMKEEDIAGKKL